MTYRLDRDPIPCPLTPDLLPNPAPYLIQLIYWADLDTRHALKIVTK